MKCMLLEIRTAYGLEDLFQLLRHIVAHRVFHHISNCLGDTYCKYKHYYSNIPICIHGIFYLFQ